jgi:hypothetical protein
MSAIPESQIDHQDETVDRLLTVQQAAHYVPCSVQTIRRAYLVAQLAVERFGRGIWTRANPARRARSMAAKRRQDRACGQRGERYMSAMKNKTAGGTWSCTQRTRPAGLPGLTRTPSAMRATTRSPISIRVPSPTGGCTAGRASRESSNRTPCRERRNEWAGSNRSTNRVVIS